MNDIDKIAAAMEGLDIGTDSKPTKRTAINPIFRPITDVLRSTIVQCMAMVEGIEQLGQAGHKFSKVVSESMYSGGLRDDITELKSIMDDIDRKWQRLVDNVDGMDNVIEG